MSSSPLSKDIRCFLTKEEIMELADLELEAIRANEMLTFYRLHSVISDYYQIALMRREIYLLKVSRQTQSTLEHE